MPAGREGDICTFRQPPNDADARLMTLAPVLLKTLTDLSNMYASTWDRVDGALVMMDSGISRFEKAHYAAQLVIAAANGVPPPYHLDEDEDDLAAPVGPQVKP